MMAARGQAGRLRYTFALQRLRAVDVCLNSVGKKERRAVLLVASSTQCNPALIHSSNDLGLKPLTQAQQKVLKQRIFSCI